MEKTNVVWFKRDLRTFDHNPLKTASQLCHFEGESCIFLYVIETDYWAGEKASPAQLGFVSECLEELKRNLQEINGHLTILQRKDSLEALQELNEYLAIEKIFCHQETSNFWGFDRDQRIKKWTQAKGIQLVEFKQGPIQRAKQLADGIKNEHFNAFYEKPPTRIKWPLKTPPTTGKTRDILLENNIPSKEEIQNICGHNKEGEGTRQKGGRTNGIQLLQSFMDSRKDLYAGYRACMGNPIQSPNCCSRISPHLTWGSLSARELWWAGKTQEGNKNTQSFLTRLRWREHFIQKFETLYQMEFYCLNPEAENLHEWNQENYERWASGTTGYPFVDACIRSLNAQKWLHFRGRAMIVSFAAYALNLDWRGFGPHLARAFLDYEPGIHYSQLQMQSGTTIGSPPRIYSPLKQSQEKDPHGEFIKIWIPELKDEPNGRIHFPWSEFRGKYPPAIVPPAEIWRIMRGNGPRKKKPETGQLELTI